MYDFAMTEDKKRKRGRPKGYRVENPHDKTLPKVRVTGDQLKAYKKASVRENQTFSAWVRDVLDDASGGEVS